AEDSIRVRNVTGVETCALPIFADGAIAVLFRRHTAAAFGTQPMRFGAPLLLCGAAFFVTALGAALPHSPDAVAPHAIVPLVGFQAQQGCKGCPATALIPLRCVA